MNELKVYNQDIPFSEDERQELTKFPREVLMSRMQDLGTGSMLSVLDVGCATSVQIAKYVTKRRGHYTGVDAGKLVGSQGNKILIAKALQQKLRAKSIPGKIICAKAQSLPLRSQCARTSIMSLVLMHVPRIEWDIVLNELIRVTKGFILLQEWDWSAVQSRHFPTEIKEFKNKTFAVMEKAGVNPYAGAELLDFVQMVTREKGSYYDGAAVRRPEADYSNELIPLSKMQAQLAEQMSMPEECAYFQSFIKRLQEKPVITLSSPNLVVATISI